jgi:V/A-type H+-transporting ATPase subunit A
VTLTSDWPIRTPRPHRGRRHDPQPFITGQRILDVLEPIAKGSSATVIGGFGEGKTVLLEQLAKWGDADVIIYLGCGERGNELADLIDELSQLVDPRSGGRCSNGP